LICLLCHQLYNLVWRKKSVSRQDYGRLWKTMDPIECLKAFAGIKSNAVGNDGISIQFLRILLPFISEHIRHIFNFNHAITCSVFPSSWKEVIVRPIAKVSSRLVCPIFVRFQLRPYCLKVLSGCSCSMTNFKVMSIVKVFCRIFNPVLDLGIARQQRW
jgi:hypothetical protein